MQTPVNEVANLIAEAPNWLVTEPVKAGSEMGLGNYLVSVGVVLALLVGTLILLRMVFLRRKGETGGGIKVLERYYFSPRTQLCLVEVNGERYLIGVTDNSVNLLTRMAGGNRFIADLKRSMGELEPPSGYGDQLKDIEAQLEELKQAIRRRIDEA